MKQFYITARAILLAGSGALIAGAVLPVLMLLFFRLIATVFDEVGGLFWGIVMVALGGLWLIAGVGICAGHLAARFDPDRPRLSAAIAAALASSAYLLGFVARSDQVPITGNLVIISITATTAIIIAGFRARQSLPARF